MFGFIAVNLVYRGMEAARTRCCCRLPLPLGRGKYGFKGKPGVD